MDQAALEVVDLARQASDAYGRPDLSQRLAQVRARVTDPHVRVLVVGEFKQGKSSLVNALVNAPICPVDDDVATSLPTAVSYAEEPIAIAIHVPAAEDAPPTREPIDLEHLAEYVSEAGNPGNQRDLWAVEVGIPRQLLATGLVLVDTPGVGGLGSAHSATTIGALPTADAVMLVSDASQEYTEPELAFLDRARDLCPSIICVMTKTDLHLEWSRIIELNREHLTRRGIEAPILATSAALRSKAVASEDRALNLESGYPALIDHLRNHVVGHATDLSRRQAAHAVMSSVGQLRGRFAAEQRALRDPDASAELVRELEATKARTGELRSRMARWQQTLNDGAADLSSDADHDLRERIRRLTQLVDDAVADVDPAEVWEQLEQWLYRAVTDEIAAHYALVTARAADLAQEVAEHFADGAGEAVADVDVHAPLEQLRTLDRMEAVEQDQEGAGTKSMTALRGSYGGMMMFGMLGSVVGLGMINPISLGFGVLLGRKALADERERKLKQRRLEAKQACRTYLDEVRFVVGKDARDTLRHLQRQLRDRFTERADELQRSSSEALDAAQAALRGDERERTGRLADVEAELGRLDTLAQRAQALVARRTPVSTPGGPS